MSNFTSIFSRYILAASLAAIMLLWLGGVSAQPPIGPVVIQPEPMNRPDIGLQSGAKVPPHLTGDEAEAFKKELTAYEQCTRDKAGGMRLTEAAYNVIQLRDRRQFWESMLLENSKKKYPNANLPPAGGYPQMLASGFAEYRSLGGTAATVEAVQPVAPSCINPWSTTTRPRVPLTDSRKMPVVPK